MLSLHDESLVSSNLDSMKGALMVLADVSEMYQRHCNMASPKGNTVAVQDSYAQPVGKTVECCEDIDRHVTGGIANVVVTDSAATLEATQKETAKEERRR
jgi:hypothetical protein